MLSKPCKLAGATMNEKTTNPKPKPKPDLGGVPPESAPLLNIRIKRKPFLVHVNNKNLLTISPDFDGPLCQTAPASESSKVSPQDGPDGVPDAPATPPRMQPSTPTPTKPIGEEEFVRICTQLLNEFVSRSGEAQRVADLYSECYPLSTNYMDFFERLLDFPDHILASLTIQSQSWRMALISKSIQNTASMLSEDAESLKPKLAWAVQTAHLIRSNLELLEWDNFRSDVPVVDYAEMHCYFTDLALRYVERVMRRMLEHVNFAKCMFEELRSRIEEGEKVPPGTYEQDRPYVRAQLAQLWMLTSHVNEIGVRDLRDLPPYDP